MDTSHVISNISILANSAHRIRYLRDFILTQAMSGAFSESKPDAWRSTTLGAEVEIVRGITFPASAKYREPAEQRIVCLRTTNVQDQVDWSDLLYVPESYVKSRDQYIRKNDILISMANSKELVGKVSRVDRDDIRCTLGGFISAIRCRDKILPEFLMLLLRTPLTRETIIDSSTQTTNIANISLGRLRPLEIKLPSLDVQREIVQRVGQFLNQCDELESTLAKHDEVSTATRKSAVSAISLAQSPEELRIAWERIQNNWELIAGSHESITYLRQLLIDLAIKGQLFGSQPIGSHGYPAAWEVNDFRSICNIEGGNQPPKSDFISEPREGYVQLFQIRDLGPNPVPVYIPKKLAKSTAKEGEILIGRYGASVGKIFRAKSGAYNVALVKFIYPKEKLDSEFVYWFLKSSRSQALFSGMSRSAQAGFNKRDLAPLLIPIPSKNEQLEIVERLNSMMEFCDDLESAFLNAAELVEKFARSVSSATS